ncbi:MAG TPA: Rnase Y domain-containing protein, partial [Coriobacteriia bacterium]
MAYVYALIALVVGTALGFVLRKVYSESRDSRARLTAERILADAEKQAETLKKESLLEAKDEVFRLKAEAETEAKERRKDLTALETRLMQREESIERRAESLDKREHQLSSQA